MTRIAVVGTCASGKSTIVAALRDRGHDAYAVAQEHSAIPRLWAHLAPERLVCLTVGLETLRRRRGDEAWPAWIYQLQLERLDSARRHADVIVETDYVSVDVVVETIVSALSARPENG
ncbi:MAG TPA: hypothetical protein VMM78_18715 [Thermomicrobiales bacterium]|nr:hypothetical protein [Thermomicrobiales bacterium]